MRSALNTFTPQKIVKLCLLAVAMVIHIVAPATTQAQTTNIVRPIGETPKPQTSQSTAVVTGNGIDFHGGPVILGPHNVYLIWYGDWSQNNATGILPGFIFNMNRTAYFNIASTYTDLLEFCQTQLPGWQA